MFLFITMILLIVAIFFSLVRMVIGPSIWERLLALNLISAKTILLLSVYGVYKQNVLMLDIAFSYGIIGFLSLTLISRLVMRGGRQK
ncbi:MAG: monovalent cation/H+ antiporter complex subunit F [Clostridia bacterium]|nr:monovalent cation/H+ antiporter complex subunit F [Clostridia bacterium]